MNLNCRLGGERIDLRQTPTQISYMCVVQPNGDVPGEVTGVKAKHALQIYCKWVEGSLNGSWNSAEDLEHARMCAADEIERIQKVIKSRKKLEVWVM